MSLKPDVESWLIDLFEFYDKDPDAVPKGFEQNFLTENAERMATESDEYFVSPKMLTIFKRIGTQRYGMDWKEYQD